MLGDDSTTTAVAVVTIQLIDINDNCPLFNQDKYTVEVDENIPNNYNLLLLTVTDMDFVSLFLVKLFALFEELTV